MDLDSFHKIVSNTHLNPDPFSKSRINYNKEKLSVGMGQYTNEERAGQKQINEHTEKRKKACEIYIMIIMIMI